MMKENYCVYFEHIIVVDQNKTKKKKKQYEGVCRNIHTHLNFVLSCSGLPEQIQQNLHGRQQVNIFIS